MDVLNAFECQQEFIKNYSHMVEEIPGNTKLELFLPTKNGPGLLATALWHGREGDKEGDWTGLPNVQNELHRLIHGAGGGEGGGGRELLPSQMRPSDVVSVNYEEIVRIIYDLFLVPNFRPSIARDLPLVEQLCMYGGPQLASFPSLIPQLPEFEYAGGEGLLLLFRSLQEKLRISRRKVAPLSSSLAKQFDLLFKNAPQSAELIFAFCAAVLIQGNQQENPLDRLVCRVRFTIPLNDEQQRGKAILGDIPPIVSTLLVEHVPALMGFCWRGKRFFNDSADLVMREEELGDLREALQKIKQTQEYYPFIPHMLCEMRTAGLTHFMQEIGEAWQENPVSLYCEMFMPKLEIYDDLEDVLPFAVPVGCFGTLLKEMEVSFGEVELMKEVMGGEKREEEKGEEGDTVVPFAAVKPFLLSREEGEGRGGKGKGKEREDKGKEREEIEKKGKGGGKGKEREEKGKEEKEKGKEEKREGKIRWECEFGNLVLF